MAQFKCKKEGCDHKGEEITVSLYTIKAVKGITTYHHKISGHNIVCSQCRTPLIFIEEPFEGFGTAHLRFNSLTSDQKKAVLKKRAKEHFNRNTDSMKDLRDHVEQSTDKK